MGAGRISRDGASFPKGSGREHGECAPGFTARTVPLRSVAVRARTSSVPRPAAGAAGVPLCGSLQFLSAYHPLIFFNQLGERTATRHSSK